MLLLEILKSVWIVKILMIGLMRYLTSPLYIKDIGISIYKSFIDNYVVKFKYVMAILNTTEKNRAFNCMFKLILRLTKYSSEFYILKFFE